MQLRLIGALSVIGCVLYGLPVAGAQSDQAPPVSLQECIRVALENQTDILVGRNNVTVARSRVTQATSSYFPQLSVQNNAFHSGQGVLSNVTNGTAFTVTQNLFDGGLREAGTQGARYGVTENTLGLMRTTQTVTFNVTKSYLDALRSKRLADVAEANVKYNEELLNQVRATSEAGTAAAIDVLPVEAQLANARVSLLSAKNAVRTSMLQLQNSMGVSTQPGFDIQEVSNVPEPRIDPLQSYVSAALVTRPDVSQFKAGVGAARASVKAARVNLYPRPVISGQYQREIQGGFTTSGTQVVGGFVFDIFNGGANRAAYKEARANQANADLQEKQLSKDIAVQVEEAYLNLTNARERLAASHIGLQAAQKNYDNQKERYSKEVGVGILLDVLNAEVQLTTARTNEVQARYDYYTSIAQLNYAVGKQGGLDAG
ncbi:MAG: TolC family protein [Armatimonadetes bacterium]|nr:TolC family protein [Armatimonadota bacterium]